MSGERIVGTVTSAGWGHRVGRNLAMGFVEPTCADVGTRLRVEIIGEPTDAAVVPACRYDPANELVRG